MRLKKKINLAFTLIELITVMAIMSLIATISVPKVSKYINRANKTKIIAAIAELNNFIISNEIDNKYEINDIKTLLSSYENIKNLKIELNTDGKFKSGNVKGYLVYNKDFVNAVLTEPKEYENEVIGQISK